MLLLERGERPGCKNLSGGRLYCYALAELLPDFQQSAPLERRITQENLTLLTRDAATTFTSLQPDGDAWSLLRARFDPWFTAQAEAEGVQLISGATVESLYIAQGRVCGVTCDNETLRARYVVLAEGANSVLAERHGFLPRPALNTMAPGIKEVLALDKHTLEERFRLEGDEGAAMLFSGEIGDDLPGGGSNSDLFMQIFADVFNLPAQRNAINGCASLGAAINTAVGLGIYTSYETAIEKMVRVKDVFTPIERNAKRYEALNKGIFKELATYTDVILKKSYQVIHGHVDNVDAIQSWSNA